MVEASLAVEAMVAMELVVDMAGSGTAAHREEAASVAGLEALKAVEKVAIRVATAA